MVRVALAAEIEDRRRALGQYYTPSTVAQGVVQWSLRGRTGRVLDPSFGGCSFLRECLKYVRGQGYWRPGDLVYGVDIDSSAIVNAQELIGAGLDMSHVLVSDFLSLRPGRFPSLFDAVVGNPPYVRHHRLRAETRAAAHRICDSNGVTRRADLWASFVLHTLRFLSDGARLAYLLPAAALYSYYAAQVFRVLVPRFKAVTLVNLRRRIFDGTQERTVLLLAEGYGSASQGAFVADASDEGDLLRLLAGSLDDERRPFQIGSGSQRAGLTTRAADLLKSLAGHSEVARLGDLSTIRLGVVTGANAFFVRSAAELRRVPGVRSKRVVSSSGAFLGAVWTAADCAQVERSQNPSRLIMIPRGRLAPELKRLIAAGEAVNLHERYKCKSRQPWYVLDDTRSPDAFLPYMVSQHPRLVLNQARATATNCIHRLWWTDASRNILSVIAGTWTSLFSLSAELEGRSYGGGVLKLEPSEAAACLVPLGSVRPGLLSEIDATARQHGRDEARAIADREILQRQFGLSAGDVADLRSAAIELAHARTPDRRRG